MWAATGCDLNERQRHCFALGQAIRQAAGWCRFAASRRRHFLARFENQPGFDFCRDSQRELSASPACFTEKRIGPRTVQDLEQWIRDRGSELNLQETQIVWDAPAGRGNGHRT